MLTDHDMQWQPIETAPRDGTKFLAYGVELGTRFLGNARWYSYGLGVVRGSYIAHSFFCYDGICAGAFTPSHWMPMPQPPEEKP